MIPYKTTNKDKIIFVLSAIVLGVLVSIFFIRKPQVAEITDSIIEELQEDTQEFQEEIQEIDERVVREVTVIRERVAIEARELPPDALIQGTIYELEQFRRESNSPYIPLRR
jgi:hypothetical protein